MIDHKLNMSLRGEVVARNTKESQAVLMGSWYSEAVSLIPQSQENIFWPLCSPTSLTPQDS